MKVLEVTGLDEVFVIHADLDALPVAAGTGNAP
jgi:anti-sigma B factor antagonist